MTGGGLSAQEGEFGTVLHVWQYTRCPCCKHEGQHSLRSAKADSVDKSVSLLPIQHNDTDGTQLVTQKQDEDTDRKQM